MPAETFSKPLEAMLKDKCSYEYYYHTNGTYSKTQKTRICHVSLDVGDKYNQNVVLMVFTIRNQSGKWKIHSEGAKRTDPGATVPLRNKAVALAKENGWKYAAIAIAGEDTPDTEVVSKYAISMESYSYGNETVYDLTNELATLKELGMPDFYRCKVEANGNFYSFAFIKKEKLVDYLAIIDNRAYQEDEDILVVADPVADDLSIEELGKILREMYDAAIGGKVSAIHMFGIKYGPIIKAKNYSTAEIIRVAGIGESYNVEVSKGISIYKVIKDNEYGIRFVDADVAEDIPATYNNIPYAWYVGATGHDENGDWMDFSDQYIAEGRWENGWDDKFIDVVNSMEVGDRIAIKAAYTKKKGLPFNNCGQVVGVMAIKAIGVITENPKDGKNIKVQWEKVDPAREWYGSGVLRTTVHYVAADEGYTRKALLDFTFNNAPQDYSLCEEKYVDEDAVAAESEMNEPAFSPRTNKLHPLNSILYGAPGTGKTYITAEYALAIIENREVDESPKTAEERKAVMEKYRSYVNDKRIVFTTFHQSYGYEDFIQGLRPVPANGGMDFVPVDGVFKHIADTAKWHPEDNYVIIIDEINRANISKVFGELITLIEDDKRWGEVNALQVTLPSGHSFKIPNNLYILGTMNSADKSISLIDTALRRRFEFIEVTPNASLIVDPVLRSVLEKLNASLVKELDSTDLLVGHAYFIGKTEDDLCNIFNRSIIPLLYEYFYDNSTKVKAQIKNALPTDQYEIIGGSVGRIKISKK